MLRSIGFATCLALLLVGCGGGGGDSGPPPLLVAPTDLQYSEGAVGLNVGVPVGPYQPTVTGTVTGYSASPALPAGLSLNATSGVISGTPLAASPETIYTITASNDAGATTFALALIVIVPPSALTYPSPVNGTVGAAFSLVPTYSGDADYFSIGPTLPTGLGIDSTTGVVSGTPTSVRSLVTYTVVAMNRFGAEIKADLLLAVDPPPAGTVVTGVFRASTVIGLGFVSGAQSGVTSDSGEFTYEMGLGITFSVGQVNIGTVPMAKSLITPVDLVADGTGTSNHVLNVVRFLMMLDQDGDASNGIQISEAVTAAAAGWAPVDFDSTDLPTTLGPLIQLASTADGVSHLLPDAASAQARLRADFFCFNSGHYVGTLGGNSFPGDYGYFAAVVFPDGSMRARADGTANLAGFEIATANALNPLLDATFVLSTQIPSTRLQGSFFDSNPAYLSGTYLADAAGTFLAFADTDHDSTYRFVGTFTDANMGDPFSSFVVLGMSESNFVTGFLRNGFLRGIVSGSTFVGELSVGCPYRGCPLISPVSGTFSKTGSALTLDGQYYNSVHELVRFSTVGCRAN